METLRKKNCLNWLILQTMIIFHVKLYFMFKIVLTPRSVKGRIIPLI